MIEPVSKPGPVEIVMFCAGALPKGFVVHEWPGLAQRLRPGIETAEFGPVDRPAAFRHPVVCFQVVGRKRNAITAPVIGTAAEKPKPAVDGLRPIMNPSFDTAGALRRALIGVVKRLAGLMIFGCAFQQADFQCRIGKLTRDGDARRATADNAEIAFQ